MPTYLDVGMIAECMAIAKRISHAGTVLEEWIESTPNLTVLVLSTVQVLIFAVLMVLWTDVATDSFKDWFSFVVMPTLLVIGF